jgi:hypothetical protein
MANIKYNWIELKKEFILSNYNTLKEFAESKEMKYDATFRKRAVGWLDEKQLKDHTKATKVIEKTIEKATDREANRNIKHLKLWDGVSDVIEEMLINKKDELTKGDHYNIYALEKLATILEKIQKGQRLAEGLDKDDKDQQKGNLDSLLEVFNKGPVK